jgi:hypothetical protein
VTKSQVVPKHSGPGPEFSSFALPYHFSADDPVNGAHAASPPHHREWFPGFNRGKLPRHWQAGSLPYVLAWVGDMAS